MTRVSTWLPWPSTTHRSWQQRKLRFEKRDVKTVKEEQFFWWALLKKLNFLIDSAPQKSEGDSPCLIRYRSAGSKEGLCPGTLGRAASSLRV